MSEQKDIWDMKPLRFSTAGVEGQGSYHAGNMDAWLEKVKAHQKDLEQIIKNQETLIEALKEKAANLRAHTDKDHITRITWGKTLSEMGVSYEAEGEWWFDIDKWNKLKVKAEKLEAVKEWCEAYKPPKRSFNKLNQAPFIQLEKILEGGNEGKEKDGC